MQSENLTIDEIKLWADVNYDRSMLAQTIFEYWDGKTHPSLKSCINYDGDFQGFTRESLLEFAKVYEARWESVDLSNLKPGKWHKGQDMLKK